MLSALVAAALALAPSTEACRALCVRDGFDSGAVRGHGCVCFAYRERFEEFMRGRITLGPAKVVVDTGAAAEQPEGE